jgi:hypothetical protein
MKTSIDRILATMLTGAFVIAACFAGVAWWAFGRGRDAEAVSVAAIPVNLIDAGEVTDPDARRAMDEGRWDDAVEILESRFGTGSDLSARRALGLSLHNAAVAVINSGSTDPGALDLAAVRISRGADLLASEPGHAPVAARALASLGIRLYESGNRDAARRWIDEARRRAAEDPYVCYAAGALLAHEGHYAAAVPLLRVGLGCDEPPIRTASQELLTRVEPDAEAEAGFSVAENSRFILRYEGAPRPDIAGRILGILEREAGTVQALIGRTPSRKIEVIVYTSADFAAARGLPDWVGGVFDGRIRIGLGDASGSDDRLRRFLAHEYAHAAVFDALGRPAAMWLDEGIAQYAEGAPPSREALLAMLGGRWTPLSTLRAPFVTLGGSDAGAAYAASLAAVSCLMERRGSGVLPLLIEDLGRGNDLDAALRAASGLDEATLDLETRQWLGLP